MLFHRTCLRAPFAGNEGTTKWSQVSIPTKLKALEPTAVDFTSWITLRPASALSLRTQSTWMLWATLSRSLLLHSCSTPTSFPYVPSDFYLKLEAFSWTKKMWLHGQMILGLQSVSYAACTSVIFEKKSNLKTYKWQTIVCSSIYVKSEIDKTKV